MEIKKIIPLALARVVAVIYFVYGLFWGIAYTVLFLSGNTFPGIPVVVQDIGIGSIVIFPVVYGVLGFVLGYIFALIYNLAAKRIGGIEFESW